MNLYDCEAIADDCSSCTRSRETLDDFRCSWCSADSICSIQSDCSQGTILTSKLLCPNHAITRFTPPSGPPDGGTTITIYGNELGASLDDFSAPNGITVGGMSCTPLDMEYESGERVLCETGDGLPVGPQDLVVTLARIGGLVSVTASEQFMAVHPTVSSIEPSFGPIAGGTELTVRGSGLDVGTSVNVTLDGPECTVT